MFHLNNIELYLDIDQNINFSIKEIFQSNQITKIKYTISVKLFVTIGILIKPQLNQIIENKIFRINKL